MASRLHPLGLALGIAVLAFFFANVEIQIEGGAGWAESLPVTFRLTDHWLLDLFWGGRPMTGYHAWVFSFMALVFHLPLVMLWQWSAKLEARVLGSLCFFWIVEDALWFVLNPAFGWSKLTPEHVPWHVNWAFGIVPMDYVTFTAVGLGLIAWSFSATDAADRPNSAGPGGPAGSRPPSPRFVGSPTAPGADAAEEPATDAADRPN